MEWKSIEGFEGYEVSPLGQVRSLTKYTTDNPVSNFNGRKIEGRVLKPIRQGTGYMSVWMKGKTVSIHRIVATAFIPNPDNLPLVQHKDDDKENNCVDNLCWGTAKSNMDDCISKGRWNNQYTK